MTRPIAYPSLLTARRTSSWTYDRAPQHPGHMATTGNIRDAIAAERRELADVLDGLSPARWDTPSLCAGWRVREVAAHMSQGFRYPLPRTLLELLKARGSLHRMTDRLARKDAATASTDQLAAHLRDNAHHPWTPPVGGLTAALGHDVIHGLDITVALGLDRRVPEDRVRALLGAVDARSLKFFGADLTGVQPRLVLRHRHPPDRHRPAPPPADLRPQAPAGSARRRTRRALRQRLRSVFCARAGGHAFNQRDACGLKQGGLAPRLQAPRAGCGRGREPGIRAPAPIP